MVTEGGIIKLLLHYISASRLKKYLQCPHSYHEAYENKVRGTADHLIFGTLMHTVFERWYEEDIMIEDLYEEEWIKSELANPAFYKDGWDIIDNFLKLNDKENHVALGLELPFAIDILNNKVYDTNKINFKNYEEVKVFLKEIEEADAPIIYGFIDRAEYDADNDFLRIVDYKTSRIALSQDEANEDVQLSMYALVASYVFPEFKRVMQELQYVRLGEAVRSYRTEQQLEVFKKWLISIFYKIRNDVEHHATLNKYCGWCDSKSNCHAYQELINGEADQFFLLNGLDDSELDEQLEKVNAHYKILGDRKKEIEAHLKEKLKRSDNSPMQVNGGHRYLTNNTRTSYDPMTVLRLFPHEAHNLFTVKKDEVEKLARGNSDFMEQLASTAVKSFTSPTLRKKKNK